MEDIEIIDVNFESNKNSIIEMYGEDLTKRKYLVNPAIAREDEIKKLIVILLTPDKSGLLVGKPGIGKTAIVEGLAYLIQRGEVPDVLKGYRIIKVNSTSLVGNMVVNGKEEMIISLLVEELKRTSRTILFIDEVHTLVGAGGAEGAIDASNHTGTITNGGTLAAHTKYSCCNKVVSSDHVMGAVTYNWSNNCSSCVATQKSSCGYTITENGTISQGTYINATCTEPAKWDYKATFATLPSSKCDAWHYAPGGGTGHSATTVKTISFSENCTKAIATAYCDVCGDEFTEEAVPTVNQTILATCTTPKRHDHKVTFKYIKEVVLCDKYHETGSPLNHSYGTPRYVWSADHETCTATVKCYRCNEEFTETQNSTLKYTEANCENVARWEHIVEDWDNDVFETILCPVVHTGTSYGDCIIDPETGLCKICGH
mgnify:CR=1 FL=1